MIKEFRKLDAFETTHFIFSEKNDCNISIIVKFTNSVSFLFLKRAISKIKKKYFLLRCGIDVNQLVFQEIENSPEISLIEKTQEEDWQSIASSEVHKLFNYQVGPLFRVCYLVGEKSNELILSMHHSISDGATLIALMSEIIKYTLNPELKFPENKIVNSFDSLSIEHIVLKELRKKKADLEPRINDQRLIKQGEEKISTGFIYKSLEIKELKKFIKKIKIKKLTFQSLFSAIVLKEFFRCKGNQSLNFTCPINIRSFFGLPEDSLGCKITLLEVFINKTRFLSCEELAFFINTKINSLVTDRYILFQGIYDLFTPSPSDISHDLVRLGVSNIGKIGCLNHLDELGLNAVYINGVLGKKFIFHPVICTFQDQVNFSFSFSNNFFTCEEARAFSDSIIKHIKIY